MTYSPLIDRVMAPARQSYGNKWSARPAGAKINGLICHHHATTGLGGVARLVESADKASANYIILNDGTLIGSVPEEYRAWTSGSYAADDDKATVEVQNETGAPEWRISAAAMATLVRLYRDLAARHGFAPVRSNIFGHRDFASTACPGPYLYPRLGDIAAAAAGGATPVSNPTTPSKPTPTPARSSVRSRGQDVRKGDTGAGVGEVEMILRDLGFYGGRIDNSAGPLLDAAIRAFQRAAGLEVDGSFGPASRTRARRTPTYPGTTVPGDRGNKRTRRYQEQLRARRFYSGRVDDSHGPQTTDALKAFQRWAHITVDGCGGPQTWTALHTR